MNLRKMPAMTFMQIDIRHPSNTVISYVVINNLDLNFKVKLVNWLFWQVSARKRITLLLPSDRKSGNLPSYGTYANVVHHDFELHFQGH